MSALTSNHPYAGRMAPRTCVNISAGLVLAGLERLRCTEYREQTCNPVAGEGRSIFGTETTSDRSTLEDRLTGHEIQLTLRASTRNIWLIAFSKLPTSRV